jgi:DNA-binding transcriptional regulator YiaG
MGKVESTIRSEIERLARKEIRRVTVPLSKDLKGLKSVVGLLRKAAAAFEKAEKRSSKPSEAKPALAAVSPEELKAARLSPRLIRTLREHLGLTQKNLATLLGVTVGTVHHWEMGKFDPRGEKKGTLVALRKLGRRQVKMLLQEKNAAAKGNSPE